MGSYPLQKPASAPMHDSMLLSPELSLYRLYMVSGLRACQNPMPGVGRANRLPKAYGKGPIETAGHAL